MAKNNAENSRFHYKANRFKQLKAFIAVAKHESIKNAAEELNIDASAITKQIQSLEEQMKIELFIRTTRKITLTEIGKKFYDVAVGKLQGIDGLYEEFILEIAENSSNHIKIAGSEFALSHYLIPKLKFLRNRKLKFTIFNITINEGIKKLIAGEVDFILYDFENQNIPEIDVKRWIKEEFILALPKNNKLCKKKSNEITLKDLGGNNLIKTSENNSFDSNFTFINGTYEMCKQATLNELGVSIYPKSYIAEKDLIIKDISHLVGFYKTDIAVKKNANIKPIVKELILELSNNFFA